MRLNKANVATLALPAGKGEMIVFDETLPGFGLRLRAGGKRTWIAQYRFGQKQRRITLGTPERLDADRARKVAIETLGKIGQGLDPQGDKQEAQRKASVTLGSIIPKYLAYAAKRQRPNYHADVKRYLELHWGPLKGVQLDRLERMRIANRLTEISEERGAFAADRSRAALSSLLSWAIGEGLTDSNPALTTNRPAELISRDRVLSPAELALVWHQAGPGDFGAIVRLLILTAGRRDEIGGAHWSELKRDTLRIDADRSKNGVAHEIPLCARAFDLFTGIQRREGRDLIFGTGEGPFSGWSKCKAQLDRRIAAAVLKDRGEAGITPWRVHDLRRTAATGMADIGVMPHIIEAVLGHISGSKAGVAGVYNRATYANEKRLALDLWAEHVTALVNGCQGKVVSFAKRGG